MINAADHVPLVWKVCRRAAARASDMLGERFTSRDVLGGGGCGLMSAIANFDPARGCQFSTLAYPWIYHQAVDYAKQLHGWRSDHNSTAMAPEADTRGEDGVGFTSRLSVDPATDDAADLRVMVALLGDRERDVIRLRYFYGMDLREAGAAIGCSHQTVANVERAAIEKMRVFYNQSARAEGGS